MNTLKKSLIKIVAVAALIAGVGVVASGSIHSDQQIADPGDTRPGSGF